MKLTIALLSLSVLGFAQEPTVTSGIWETPSFYTNLTGVAVKHYVVNIFSSNPKVVGFRVTVEIKGSDFTLNATIKQDTDSPFFLFKLPEYKGQLIITRNITEILVGETYESSEIK